eukprot:TRINITY_DN47861_c0_g1_i1.p1 TRINITY_DN47861_c0_g1~~TRINITY_DN47861_c0_g1_i1.p1  ORF type:complete len:365 (+),score=96.53 TRINITY_DN47861_c0_g1_i1:56-1096(+)
MHSTVFFMVRGCWDGTAAGPSVVTLSTKDTVAQVVAEARKEFPQLREVKQLRVVVEGKPVLLKTPVSGIPEGTMMDVEPRPVRTPKARVGGRRAAKKPRQPSTDAVLDHIAGMYPPLPPTASPSPPRTPPPPVVPVSTPPDEVLTQAPVVVPFAPRAPQPEIVARFPVGATVVAHGLETRIGAGLNGEAGVVVSHAADRVAATFPRFGTLSLRSCNLRFVECEPGAADGEAAVADADAAATPRPGLRRRRWLSPANDGSSVPAMWKQGRLDELPTSAMAAFLKSKRLPHSGSKRRLVDRVAEVFQVRSPLFEEDGCTPTPQKRMRSGSSPKGSVERRLTYDDVNME